MAETPTEEDKLKAALIKYLKGDPTSRPILRAYIAKHGVEAFKDIGGPCLREYIEKSYTQYKQDTNNVVRLH